MKRAFLIIIVLSLGAWPLLAQLSVTNGTTGLTLTSSGNFGVAYQNVPYSGGVQTSGGTAPYSYTVLTGSLPTGITQIGTTASFTGTPTGTGTSSFTIQVTDSSSVPQTKQLATGITISTLSSLAVGPTGQTITTGTTNFQMTVSGVWSNGCSTTCPSLLTLVTWAPTTFGTAGTLGLHTGLLNAGSAAATPSVTAAFNSITSPGVTVTVTSSVPVVSNGTLPNGQINQVYPETGGVNTLACSGGSGTTTFANSSGALPSGVTLNTSTGVLSGTATASGTFTPAFTCTNVGGTSAPKTLNIVIASLSTISALSPAAPTAAQFGQQQFIATCNYSDRTSATCQPASGGGVITSGTGVTGSNNTTNVATLATSSSIAVSVGQTYVISYYSDNAATPTYTVPTDTAGNTAVAATAQLCEGGASDRCERTYYMPITIANASDTFTAHFGTATHPVVINVVPLTGTSASPFDQNGNSDGSSTAANQATSASITPTVTNTMAVFTANNNGGGRTFTAGTGCTMRITDATGFVGVETCPIATTSATTEQITFNGAADLWIGAISNYKPAAGGSGLVWSATDASGGPNVATITNVGLATANNPGTTNIEACIGATCSANDLMTVTGVADTSIVTVCPSSINIGANAGQCTATGQPSGTNDTNTATWTQSTPSLVTVNSTGGLTGVANGTCPAGCITASIGSLHGTSGAMTVSTPGSGGLLSGCTFIGSGGCSLPGGGWSLVAQQDFECSLSHAIPANPGCGQLPAAQTFSAFTPNVFETTQVHSGTYAFGGQYTGDGSDVGLIFGTGGGTGDSWSALGSFTALYISYWEYTDPNAQYGNSDYYLNHVGSPTLCSGTQQDYAYDAEFSGNTAPISTAQMMVIANGNTGNNACQGYYQTGTAAGLPMMAGQWRQVEILFQPSTSITPPQQYGPSNCTPTTPGCGNGLSQLFINGVMNQQSPNSDLNGTTSMANSFVEVGGVLTDFCDGPSATIRAVPFTLCQSAAPTAFHRYFDDIIILKR